MRAIGMSIVMTLTIGLASPAGAFDVAAVDRNASDEVVQTVDAAAARWWQSLSGRSGCVSAVSVVFEDLPARKGEYRTRAAAVVIDTGVPVSELARVAVHELAHHAFVSCGAYGDRDLKSAFYAAVGIPSDREWFDYTAGWSATPAELFAEAVTVVVEGASAHGLALNQAGVDVVRSWMQGSPIMPASAPLPAEEPEPEAEESEAAPASQVPEGPAQEETAQPGRPETPPGQEKRPEASQAAVQAKVPETPPGQENRPATVEAPPAQPGQHSPAAPSIALPPPSVRLAAILGGARSGRTVRID